MNANLYDLANYAKRLGEDKLAKQIATDKLEDLNTDDVEMATRIVAGTARSMGIEVVD